MLGTIKTTNSSLAFDSASVIQKAGRLFLGGKLPVTQEVHQSRDLMHEFVILMAEVLWAEPDCKALRHHLLAKQSLLIRR